MTDQSTLLDDRLDDECVKILLDRSLLDQDTIDELVEEQDHARAKAKAQLTGTVYAISLRKRALIVMELVSGTVLKEIPLSHETAREEALPEPQAVPIALLDPEGGLSLQSWQPGELYGLVLTPETSYLYVPDALSTPILAESAQCFYPGPPPAGCPVYDLYLGEDHAQLFVVDREAGDLLVFETKTNQLLTRVAVRPHGSKKGLNLAFDPEQQRLLMTDNQSFMLYSLDLEDYSLDRIDIEMSGYALGPLALSPDGTHFYLMTNKPTMDLFYLDIETMELIRQIPFEGEAFTGLGDPHDLLVLSPDKRQLLFVSSQPGTQAPQLSVVDAAKARALQHQALDEKPALLAFPLRNRIFDHQKNVLELLLQDGVLSEQAVEKLRLQAASVKVVDLDAPDAPEEGQGRVPTLDPSLAPTISLPADSVLPLIVSLLCDKVYQQTEADLSAQPEDLAALQLEAERARAFLENHDAAEVKLPGLLGEFDFETLLTRQEILIRIEKAAATPPANCPACSRPLSSWDCAHCDLELESPERAAWIKNSSLTPLANVPQFHILLADPERKRLLMLDHNRTLDWVLEGEQLPSPSPWGVLWLPNKNLLILDRDHSQLHECGPSGKVRWSLDQKAPPALQLNRPVKATYFAQDQRELFLIVDQGNHRVLAVDRDYQVHWQYGQRGQAGSGEGSLNRPSDLQRTQDGSWLIADTGNDRVLEIRDGALLRSYGPELGLSSPSYAQRLANQHTLIVDAGNYRVLELDADGDVAGECFYFKEELGEAMRIDLPIHVIRGEKNNLLLMDEQKAIELLPARHRLVWSSLLEHLASRVEIKEESLDAQEQYVKSFYQYKMPTMDQILERLKNKNNPDDSNSLAARLMANFSRLLEVRRVLDSQRAQRTKVKSFGRGPLSQTPIYVIDRTYQLVIQVDRKGKPLWHFGAQPGQKLLRPGQVIETEASLLIADTSNQRVLEVSKTDNEVLLVLGDKTEALLNQPRSAWRTLAGNTLIADQGNRRLVELDAAGQVVWEFKNLVQIVSPYFAAEQGTGTILYVDWALQVVKEISRDGTVIWSYGQSRRVGNGPNQLSSPEYAVRLPAGSTLIADTHNNRVIEVAPNRKILWECTGSKSLPLDRPSYCKRLPDGHTLIAYDNYRQLVEVDKAGQPRWHFEMGNTPLVRAESI